MAVFPTSVGRLSQHHAFQAALGRSSERGGSLSSASMPRYIASELVTSTCFDAARCRRLSSVTRVSFKDLAAST